MNDYMTAQEDATALGITYPPTLLLVLALGLASIWALMADLERSEQERRLRRLFQRLAVLEALLEETGSEVPQCPPEADEP